jgi:hypothetical protein
MPDRPGYGGSTRRPGRSVPGVAEAVRALADAQGWKRFAVFGGSGGGPHALACAALLPERVIRCARTHGGRRDRIGRRPVVAAVEGRPPYGKFSPMAPLTALATEPPKLAAQVGVLGSLLAALLEKDSLLRADAATGERLPRRAAAGEELTQALLTLSASNPRTPDPPDHAEPPAIAGRSARAGRSGVTGTVEHAAAGSGDHRGPRTTRPKPSHKLAVVGKPIKNFQTSTCLDVPSSTGPIQLFAGFGLAQHPHCPGRRDDAGARQVRHGRRVGQRCSPRARPMRRPSSSPAMSPSTWSASRPTGAWTCRTPTGPARPRGRRSEMALLVRHGITGWERRC